MVGVADSRQEGVVPHRTQRGRHTHIDAALVRLIIRPLTKSPVVLVLSVIVVLAGTHMCVSPHNQPQAVAGLLPDGRQVVNRAQDEATSYKS